MELLIVLPVLAVAVWLFFRFRGGWDKQPTAPRGGRAVGPEQRDWSTGDVEPVQRLLHHEAPRFDSVDLVEEAIAVSGAPAGSVDKIRAITGVWAVREGQAVRNFETIHMPAAAEALRVLGRRPDFNDTLFWNFFGHWGAEGMAVQQSVSELYTSGQLLEVIVGSIRSHALDHDLGGSSKL